MSKLSKLPFIDEKGEECVIEDNRNLYGSNHWIHESTIPFIENLNQSDKNFYESNDGVEHGENNAIN